MKNTIDERGGPWTQHGHPIAGLTVYGDDRPNAVARCGGPAICSDCAAGAERLRQAAAGATAWLVWSNQKTMWWRANRSGYTQFIEEAGRYSGAEAREIVSMATVGGELKHRRVDPVTEKPYTSYDEVAVLAPEATA